tara:strand:+ start:43 stop:798 length:756 start_codon:yes stop_codon:yes gene_type:complete
MAKIYPEGYHTTPKKKKKKKKIQPPAQMQEAPPSKPVQGAGNMPLNDEQTARQVKFLKSKNKEEEVKKPVKKMNMGGMAIANKYDRNRKEKMREAKKPEVPRFDKADFSEDRRQTPDRPPGMKKGGTANKMARGGMAIANKYDRNRIEKMREAEHPLFDPPTPTPKQEPPETIPDHGFKNGGMTSKMSKQKGGNTVIVDPAKKSPKSRMKTSGSGSKMAMMKEGGNIPKYKAGNKVRGYGKARGGKACKMR